MIPAQSTRQLVKIPSGQTLSSVVLSIKVLDTSKIKVYRDNVLVTAWSASGDTVSFNPPITGQCTLSIVSDEPIAREYDITKATEWNSSTINTQLDKIQLQIQQVRDSIGLVMKPSDENPLTPADMQRIYDTSFNKASEASASASEAKNSATASASSASTALQHANTSLSHANDSRGYMDESRRFMEMAEAVDLGYFMQDAVGAVPRLFTDKVRETVSVKDFGAVGDGVTDCYDAIMNAINSSTKGQGWYVSGPAIYFPPGIYYCSKTINLKKSVKLYGDASGLPTTANATIKFAAGITGIIVNRYNTYSNYVETTPTTAADGTSIEGLIIFGARGNIDECGGHGIWLRARALIKNCLIGGFDGNGIHVYAASNGKPDFMGNANGFNIECCRITGCDNGVYIFGYDANAGTVNSVDCSNNRLWGFYDGSFLGNTLIACHTSANGIDGNKTAYTRYNSKCYHAVPGATEQQLCETEPGTNINVWYPCNSTSYAISWTGENPIGTFRPGGGYASTNLNARGVWIGCYSEGGQGVTWGSQHSLIIGGLFTECPPVTGGYIGSRFGTMDSLNGFRASSQEASGLARAAYLGDSSGFIRMEMSYKTPEGTDNFATWRFKTNGYDFYFDNANYSGHLTYTITGPQTKMTFGTSTPQIAYFNTARFALGSGAYARRHATGAGYPTAGQYARGDIIFNINPSFNGYAGWICIVGGEPGTWAPFGKIE